MRANGFLSLDAKGQIVNQNTCSLWFIFLEMMRLNCKTHLARLFIIGCRWGTGCRFDTSSWCHLILWGVGFGGGNWWGFSYTLRRIVYEIGEAPVICLWLISVAIGWRRRRIQIREELRGRPRSESCIIVSIAVAVWLAVWGGRRGRRRAIRTAAVTEPSNRKTHTDYNYIIQTKHYNMQLHLSQLRTDILTRHSHYRYGLA